MDTRWRNLQRSAAQGDLEALDQLIATAARSGVFSQIYLNYLSNIRMPLGLSIMGKGRGKFDDLYKSWKKLPTVSNQAKYLTYQRILILQMFFMKMLKNDPNMSQYDSELSLIQESLEFLRSLGPDNSPNTDANQNILNTLQEKLRNAQVRIDEDAEDPDDLLTLDSIFNSSSDETMIDFLCDVSHCVGGFMNRLFVDDNDPVCTSCGVEYHWDKLIKYLPLVLSIERYLRSKIELPIREATIPNEQESRSIRWKKQRQRVAALRRARRKARRDTPKLLRKLLRKTERILWEENIQDFYPGVVWNR